MMKSLYSSVKGFINNMTNTYVLLAHNAEKMNLKVEGVY